MQYGTQLISNETVSVYQGSVTLNSTSNTFQSIGFMGVVEQRVADVYSMWKMVSAHNYVIARVLSTLKQVVPSLNIRLRDTFN